MRKNKKKKNKMMNNSTMGRAVFSVSMANCVCTHRSADDFHLLHCYRRLELEIVYETNILFAKKVVIT